MFIATTMQAVLQSHPLRTWTWNSKMNEWQTATQTYCISQQSITITSYKSVQSTPFKRDDSRLQTVDYYAFAAKW